MNRILLGALLVFFDITITVGDGKWQMMPAFIGYLLVWTGLRAILAREEYLEPVWKRTLTLNKILVVITLLEYFQMLSGISLGNIYVYTSWSVVQIFLTYTFWKDFINGIAEVEKFHTVDLNTDKLDRALVLWTCIEAAVLLAAMLPVQLVLAIVILAGAVLGIYFIAQLYVCKKNFDRELPM